MVYYDASNLSSRYNSLWKGVTLLLKLFSSSHLDLAYWISVDEAPIHE